MLPSAWTIFFTIEIATATGIAGLLFISFSIYFSRGNVDFFERRLGSIYLLEAMVPLVISLSALLPPYWWWAGGLGISMVELVYLILTYRVARDYRSADASVKEAKSKGVQLGTAGPQLNAQARIYAFHKGHINTFWIPILEAFLMLLFSVVGMLVFAALLPVPLGWPLQATGALSAWYMLSASFGSWYFLFQISARQHQRQTRCSIPDLRGWLNVKRSSVEDLVQKTKLSKETIQKIEIEHEAYIGVVGKLAKGLDITISELQEIPKP